MTDLIKDGQGNFRVIDSVIYLYLNPDVRPQIEAGTVGSAAAHYLAVGQDENRVGAPLLDEVFDEKLYLEENPDVARAVALGGFASARDHYIKWGHKEGRSGGPEVDAENPPEFRFPGPLPSPHLRRRVHGVTQIHSFERIGKQIADTLAEASPSHLQRIGGRPKVLDFGCGCARVLPYLKLIGEMEIVGADIDAEAIAWCRENLSDMATFVVNEGNPPLAFPSETFDLIYSISVMTHLPENMQKLWLAELARIAKPGALLLLTTRGIHGVPLNWRQRLRFRLKGFWYGGGRLTPGLPSFYRSAFHTEAYVRKVWGRFFEILEFRPRGLNGDQDLVICAKRS